MLRRVPYVCHDNAFVWIVGVPRINDVADMFVHLLTEVRALSQEFWNSGGHVLEAHWKNLLN